jgi:hypothetical protein
VGCIDLADHRVQWKALGKTINESLCFLKCLKNLEWQQKKEALKKDSSPLN